MIDAQVNANYHMVLKIDEMLSDVGVRIALDAAPKAGTSLALRFR